MLKIQAAVCDFLKGLVRREEGVTAIEYGLIAALIAVVKRSMQTRSVVRLSPLLVALALSVVPVLFASTQGCSSTPDDATGSAELIATTAQELTSADVTRVTITITGAGIATPITHDLVRVSGQWRGTLGAIPVGSGRNFHGDAFDAAGAVVYRGDVPSVTITKGATALVALLMQQVQAPTPFHNSAPRIDSTTASSNAVAPGDVVMLAATAHDPDGDALTIAWSTTGGTFTDPSTLTPQWTAPATEGSYDLTVRATDPKGAVATTTFSVNVAASNGRGSAGVTTTLNTWPEVALVNASPTRIDVGESTTLSIVASDADSDALHYAWTATCAGSFDNAASQAPRFTLAAPLPAGNACALVATVTDGRGGTNTGQISISTGPGALVGLAPVIDATFQSSEAASAGVPVVFRVTAHDPESTALSFAWSASAGTFGAPATGSNTSVITWTAPASFSASATISATVTDADGVSTVVAFSVATGTAVTVGGSPAGATLSPDGTRVYVSNTNAIDVIDVASGHWVDTIPTLRAPGDVRVSADGTTLYVAYGYGVGSTEVTRIDVATHTQTGHLAMPTTWGSTPLAMSRDGSKLYAGNYPYGPIQAIDVATFSTGATFGANTYDNNLVVSPDGSHLWLGNYNIAAVRVIDLATGGQTSISVPGGYAFPIFSPDGTLAYVRSGTAGTPGGASVSKIDVASLSVLSTTALAENAQGAIAIGPNGQRLVVTNNDTNSVTVLDAQTMSILGRTAFASPSSVAVTNTTAYLPLYVAGTVIELPLP